jgi:hypothetical protein
MSLEDRIRSAVDVALDDLRARVEADMRELVDQLLAAANQERDEAVNAARRQAFDEAWDSARREMAEHSARARDVAEQAIAEARAEERVAADRRTEEALVAAELRFVQARREADLAAARRVEVAVSAAESRLAAVHERHSRLLEGIRGLDGATTLSEVLDALGAAVAREAPRAAVLLVRHDRLAGWKLAGFGPRDLHPKAVDIAVADSGLTGRAVSEARPASSQGAAIPGLLVDEPDDTDALAVPVIVGGRVMAVVYASRLWDATAVTPDWRDAVEILVRHGARCLEALTVQKASASTSPRFWVPSTGHSSAAASASDQSPTTSRVAP